MKTASQVLLAIAIGTALAACTTKAPVQTVAWYETHDAERTSMVKRCNANPGELADTPNCVNAIDAANANTWASRGGISGVKAPTFGAKAKSKD